MAEHTPGLWREGKPAGSIVSDQPVKGDSLYFPVDTEDSVRYYGGHVVAESVAMCNRPLIIAAPNMLRELELLLHRKTECEEILSNYMEARIRAVVTKARGDAS